MNPAILNRDQLVKRLRIIANALEEDSPNRLFRSDIDIVAIDSSFDSTLNKINKELGNLYSKENDLPIPTTHLIQDVKWGLNGKKNTDR